MRHFEKLKYISAAVNVSPINLVLWGIMTLNTSDRQKFEILKIPDGGGCHCEKLKIRHILTIFDRLLRNLVHFTLLTDKISKFKNQNSGCRHFEKSQNSYISVTVWPIATKFGDCLEGKRENYQVCSVQYCVQQLYTVNCTHIWTDLTVLWIGFCLTGPISLCLDSFLCMYYFVSHCILHARVVL